MSTQVRKSEKQRSTLLFRIEIVDCPSSVVVNALLFTRLMGKNAAGSNPTCPLFNFFFWTTCREIINADSDTAKQASVLILTPIGRQGTLVCMDRKSLTQLSNPLSYDDLKPVVYRFTRNASKARQRMRRLTQNFAGYLMWLGYINYVNFSVLAWFYIFCIFFKMTHAQKSTSGPLTKNLNTI